MALRAYRQYSAHMVIAYSLLILLFVAVVYFAFYSAAKGGHDGTSLNPLEGPDERRISDPGSTRQHRRQAQAGAPSHRA